MRIREYNRPMPRCPRCSVVVLGFLSLAAFAAGQTAAKTPSAGGPGEVQRAIDLAESGHCAQAMPTLKKAIHQVSDRELRKRIGLDGVRCAMTHNAPYDSLDFLAVLSRDFPRDPDVLYAAAHAYSDLSLKASQDLAREAPFSFQVHELNAEALELQQRWDDAAAEYRKIIEINPFLPGIHARLGRALLSKPQPSAEDAAQAKKAFEQELEIDPKNANAEYVLGELTRGDQDYPTAIRHFTKATKLDPEFSEAYLGLGTALTASKQFAEAIPSLETYEKMAPDSPTGHYQLALAYAGVGRKDDSNREAGLQRQTAEALEAVKRRAATAMEGNSSTAPAEQK
jgi:tetratricopeptide (TPR) repeat protein